jgi:glycosidase
MSHWSYNAFFYHIYPLGFCNAPNENDFISPPVNRLDLISDWIPYMQALGINSLYLGPVFESTTHGYDTADYYNVDRRLGTNENLIELVKNLHDAGIKVILDGVFNHTGRNFWAFKDVQNYGQNSIYCDWISGLNFGQNSPFNDAFSYQGWEGHYNLVKLNLKNPQVKEHLFKAIEMWINTFKIDGLRLDVAYCLDREFLKELRSFCKSLKPDFWLLGEVLHGDYRTLANSEMLDSVTNYDCYKGLFSSHNDKNYHEIGANLARQFGEYGLYKDFITYNFADNHDVNRIASTLKNPAHLYPLHAILMFMPGCPSIYYGSEFGIEGKKHNGSDLPLRPGFDYVKNTLNHCHPDLYKTIKQFYNIRKESHAIKYGKYFQGGASSEQLGFIRQSDEESLIIVINASSEPGRLELYNLPIEAGQARDILNADGATYSLNRNRTIIDNIPPCWARVLKAF